MLLATGCKHCYHIEGTSTSSLLDGRMLYLKVPDGEILKIIDSCEVLHGAFTMKGDVKEPLFTQLFMDGDNLMPVVLESGHIIITLDEAGMRASGTPFNDQLYNLINARTKYNSQLDELEHRENLLMMDGVSHDEAVARFAAQRDTIMRRSRDLMVDFMHANYDNVLGPNVFIMLCSTLPYPMITPEIEMILNDAPPAFCENPYIKEFVAMARENMLRLSRGN